MRSLGMLGPIDSALETNATMSFSSACLPPRLELEHKKPMLKEHFEQSSLYPLDAAAFLRSQPKYPANFSRIRSAIRKLRCSSQKDKFRIVVLGGSVPKGDEIPESIGGPWPSRFISWLNSHSNGRGGVDLLNLAVPGTNSLWRVAEIDNIPFKSADVLIVDYTTNDMLSESGMVALDSSDGLWRRVRSATETLLRHALSASPDLAIIYLGLTRGWRHGGPDRDLVAAKKAYSFQDEVYGAVLKHYGVPLVSFRDAIWPERDRPPRESRHLFDTKVTVHPEWYVHQLIADIFAYSWVVQEVQLPPKELSCASDVNSYRTVAETEKDVRRTITLPAPKFSNSDLDALQSCQTLTHLNAANGTSSFQPLRIGDGWRLITSNRHKIGWQYEANGSSFHSTITFSVRFGVKPILGVLHLKSYRSFGSAAFWFGDRENPESSIKRIRDMYNTNRVFARTCRQRWLSKDHRKKSIAMNSPACRRFLSGMPSNPWIIDSQWADKSSQSDVTVFTSGWGRKDDRKYLLDGTPYYDQNEDTSLIEPNSETTLNFQFFETSTKADGRGRLTRFKIMGILTC